MGEGGTRGKEAAMSLSAAAYVGPKRRRGRSSRVKPKGVDFRVLEDYLDHRDPAMTARYTRVSSRRFEGLWD